MFIKILKLIPLLVFLIVPLSLNANEVLKNFSDKVSEVAAGFIPGDGLTEVEIEIKEGQEPDFSILGVRDIIKTENSNFFTQFSLNNNDVSGKERFTGNLGAGYRILTDSESLMIGVNSFFDQEFVEGHQRASIGFEARASVLEFNTNKYWGLSSSLPASGATEKSIGSIDYNLATQVPYMPWAKFRWTGYVHNADKGKVDSDGEIYSLDMALNPTLQLDVSQDITNDADGDANAINLSFIYPPRENKPTLVDGILSDEIWFKESMEDKLSDKVERNNNLVVEIQGAVIFTKK